MTTQWITQCNTLYSMLCRPGPQSWSGFTLLSYPLIQNSCNYFEQDERSSICSTLTEEQRGEGSKDIFEPEGKQVALCSSIIVLPTAKRRPNRWKPVSWEKLSLDKVTQFKAICFIDCFPDWTSRPICAMERQNSVLLTVFESSSMFLSLLVPAFD